MIIEANIGHVWLIRPFWNIVFNAPPGMKLEIGTELIPTMEKMGVTTFWSSFLEVSHTPKYYEGISGLFIHREGLTNQGRAKEHEIRVWVCDPKDAPKKHLDLFCQKDLSLDVMASAILIHELTHYQQAIRLGVAKFSYSYNSPLGNHDALEAEARAAEDAYVRAVMSGEAGLLLRFL
ncbi:MAG: hypothetical protein WEC81_01250 [Patescibacteria group bacterium]